MKKIVSATLLAVFALPAIASDFYVGVNAGFTNYGFSNISENNKAGWNIFVGYQISRLYSVEVEYAGIGGFNDTYAVYEGSAVGVKGVGTFPLGKDFSLIGKVGIAGTTLKATVNPGYYLVTDNTVSDTGLAAGFAGQYNVSPEFGIRAGIDVYPVGSSSTGRTTARLLSVGGVFKF